MTRSTWWQLGALAVVSLGLTVLFLSRPLHVDDAAFVWFSEHLAAGHWFHPCGPASNWEGTLTRPAGVCIASVLYPYALLPAAGHIWLMRLLQGLWVVVGIVGVARLAWRFDAPPVAAAWLFATSIAIAAVAQQLLPDVSAAALAVWGVEQCVAWSRQGSRRNAAAAALLLAMSALARPHAAAISVALFVAAVVSRNQAGWRWQRVCAAVAAAGLLALGGYVATAEGSFGLGTAPMAAPGSTAAHVAGLLGFFVMTTPGLGLLVFRARRDRSLVVECLAVAAALLCWSAPWSVDPTAPPLWIGPVAGLGLAALVGEFVAAGRRADPTRRFLAIWMLTPFVVVPYHHVAVKYWALAAPAIAIGVARLLDGVWKRRLVVAGCAAIGLATTWAIAIADMRFARLNVMAVERLIKPRIARGENVWIAGHWGFQYYAERAGARHLDRNVAPQAGDVLVAATVTDGADEVRSIRDRLVATEEGLTDRRPGWRTISVLASAGFYDTGWGYLPLGWSHKPIETFRVFRFK